jgi:hypothetical protein
MTTMKMNEQERHEQRMNQVKDKVLSMIRRMSAEEIFEMHCAIVYEGMCVIERAKEMEGKHVSG